MSDMDDTVSGFECPSCGANTPKLVIYEHPRKLGCPNCGKPKPQSYSVAIGSVVQTYRKKNGSTGRITHGKAWEIENRTISRDDKMTVINKVTGKETQY